MYETFNLTLNQVLMLSLFMLIGYFLSKKNIISKEAPEIISKLEVWVFMPALCFKTFSSNFNKPALMEKYPLIFTGIILWTITFFIAILLAKLFAKGENDPLYKKIYIYTFTYPNFGYVGYPLVLAVFGEGFLFDMMMMSIPYNITVYSLAFYILDPQKSFSVKSFINPPIIGVFIGMILGMLNVKTPVFISETISSASACMAPMAMILTGYVLASAKIKTTLKNAKVYLVALLRLLIIPATAGFVLYYLGVDNLIIIVSVALLAMPTGLNSIIVPQSRGVNITIGAECAFLSNLLGIITIPIIFAILTNLIG